MLVKTAVQVALAAAVCWIYWGGVIKPIRRELRGPSMRRRR